MNFKFLIIGSITVLVAFSGHYFYTERQERKKLDEYRRETARIIEESRERRRRIEMGYTDMEKRALYELELEKTKNYLRDERR